MEILLHVSVAMLFHDPEIPEYVFVGKEKCKLQEVTSFQRLTIRRSCLSDYRVGVVLAIQWEQISEMSLKNK